MGVLLPGLMQVKADRPLRGDLETMMMFVATMIAVTMCLQGGEQVDVSQHVPRPPACSNSKSR
jgi:hypothetical protein